MDVIEMEELIRNIDHRLQRVEQILPTLATKEDLRGLATKDDLRGLATKAEIRKLATKAEIRELATKTEIRELATKEEVRKEGELTRAHFSAVAEDLRSDIRKIAEGHAHLDRRLDEVRTEIKADIANIDTRVTKLDARVMQLDGRVMRLEVSMKSAGPRPRKPKR